MFPKETKILIVDDMMTMRKLVRKTVSDLGLTNSIEANDGDTAWQEIEKALASNEPFQLIISDWNMPKMMGIDLLKKVRGNEKMKNVPFIFLTAEAEKDQVLEAMKAGATNYIIKPFTPAVVQQRLSAAYSIAQKKLAAAA